MRSVSLTNVASRSPSSALFQVKQDFGNTDQIQSMMQMKTVLKHTANGNFPTLVYTNNFSSEPGVCSCELN